MAKTFDFMKETISVHQYRIPTKKQGFIIQEFHLTRILKFRPTKTLPKYVEQSVRSAGYYAIKLGNAPDYKYSIWGLGKSRTPHSMNELPKTAYIKYHSNHGKAEVLGWTGDFNYVTVLLEGNLREFPDSYLLHKKEK